MGADKACSFFSNFSGTNSFSVATSSARRQADDNRPARSMDTISTTTCDGATGVSPAHWARTEFRNGLRFPTFDFGFRPQAAAF